MNILRQFTRTMSAQFAHVITQLENHEALAESAIREMQTALGEARGQLGRVKRDGVQLEERLQQARTQSPKWQERAVQVAGSDKSKALECIKRKKALEREAAELEKQLVEHRRLEQQLSGDLLQLESRISELKRKKNAYAARQSRAEAMEAQSFEYVGGMNEINDIFERWDTRLTSYVLTSPRVDELEQCFVEEEERAELEAELTELMKSEK